MEPLRFRRRTLGLFALLALLLVASATALVWQWKAPAAIRARLESLTGHRVTVGAVHLDWHLDLVVRDVVIFGSPPFDSQNLARIDRMTVHLRDSKKLLNPSEIVVDGVDIGYLATADGDNLRGPTASRKSALAASGRADRADMPRIVVRNARLRGSLVRTHGPHIALRAPQAEIERDAKGLVQATLHHLVIDAEGVASMIATTFKVDLARGGVSVFSGTGVALEVPGGGTLMDNLSLDGTIAALGSTFDLHSNEVSLRQVVVAGSWNGRFAEASADLHDLPLRALGGLTGGRTLGLENATGSLHAHVAVDRPALRATFDFDGKIAAFDLLHPGIDVTPWRNQSGTLSLRGQLDLPSSRVDVDAMVKALGASLKVKGVGENMHSPRGRLTISTTEHAPLSCPVLLQGQPAPVQQALAGLDLQGNLGFRVQLGFDTSAWEDLSLDFDVNPICTVKTESRALADLLPILRKPKTAQPPPGIKLPLGAYHSDFVPLAQMPHHLPAAFITSEDSKFYHHHGFDTDMIRHALAQDLANRSFDRGASTITQQLAKNLFLTYRRTLARKLEEAVLTWRLQKLLSKDRVLELYLNVIELGPGIRGVKQAARKYFGKDVGDLTPLESAHLAALTPNPRVLARRFRDGQVDEGWQQRLYDLLGMMKRHRRLTAEELAAAHSSKLELRDLGRDPSL